VDSVEASVVDLVEVYDHLADLVVASVVAFLACLSQPAASVAALVEVSVAV
jgi:hypothetical protein